MTYFCFIESSVLSTPHMEPLAASSRTEAVEEAAVLMMQHSSALAAHVFLDEERVETILASVSPAALRFAESRQNAAI